MKKSLFLLALLVAVPACMAQQIVEEIVARINNDIVTRTELARSRDQALLEAQQPNNDPTHQAPLEKDVLRDLVDRQLLLQKGKDLGINGDTEVIKRLDEMRKSMKLESLEDLEKYAAQQGVSFEDYKQNLREGYITQTVISREVGSHMQITQEEIKKFYDEHQKDLDRPEEIRLSEILFTPDVPPAKEGEVPAEPTAEALAAAEQKAKAARDEIQKGLSFEDAAKKYSHGPTAQQGGDIGGFRRGTLAKSLEDTTFALKKGEVSDVIQTKQGFIILKVTEHPKPGVAPMKEVEQNIQESLYYEKLQPALRVYLTKLREEAYIDIKTGYVDTGASPNQTKPIITEGTGAASVDKTKPKKKKHIYCGKLLC